MPSRTPEQVAAQEAMDAAIEKMRVAYNRIDVGEETTLVGWAAVAYSVRLDEDMETSLETTDIFTSHGMMMPTAQGLFHLGLKHVEPGD